MGELGSFGLGEADTFLVSGRAIDDNIFLFTAVGAFLASKDLREPVKNGIARGNIRCRSRCCCRIISLRAVGLSRMCRDGTLLEQFDAVKLTVDPPMPDVPWHLFLLAKAVQLALRNLR